MQRNVLLVLVCLLCLGCEERKTLTGTPTTSYPSQEVTSLAEIPAPEYAEPQRPAHNYDERDGVLYSYIAAISEDERKAGKGAGDVITFAYLGEQDGRHVLATVGLNGHILGRSWCRKPCRVITRQNGERLGYDEGSIIGAAFADALAGRLQVARLEPIIPTSTATLQSPIAPSPPPPVSSWSIFEQGLIDKWMALNLACRGGSDPAAVEIACAERDGPASEALVAQNICYGRVGEHGYQHAMHRCGDGSFPMSES